MADVEDVFELPPMPAGMLLHTLMAPQSGTYFQQCWCILNGELDLPRFTAAWQQVIRRHQVLRSECHWEDLDRPVQVIYDNAEPEWYLSDWSHLGVPEQQNAFAAWLEADRERGFHLDQAPLLRFALISLSESSHRFVWSFHHLLMDGWCGSLLVGEMLRLYAGIDAQPVPPPYRRYIEWRETQDEKAAQIYWSKALAGCDGPTPLGIDRAAGEAGEQPALEIREVLDAGLVGRLVDMARHHRVTFATILQGAWALLLSRYSGQDDVVFGTVLSGRPPELPGVEHMVGLFLNTVPVRVCTNPQHPLSDWLREIQSEHRLREKFSYAPLSDIQRWADSGKSLFESLLIVENFPLSMQGAIAAEGSDLSLSDAGSYERTHYPLTLRVFPEADTVLSLTVDLARIARSDAERLLRHLRNLLSAFAGRPHSRLGEFDLLDPQEREAILQMGRGPETAAAAPVHEQILARAGVARDKTALIHVGSGGDVSMTYDALGRRIAVLAAALHKHGVGRGAVVAVCMERGPDLVPSLLAVMASGATYLPVDPGYPSERIGDMVRDSGTVLILSDHTRHDIPGLPQDIVVLCTREIKAYSGAFDFTPVPVRQDHLAYILYTSGSTGKPKGVPITHGALANFMQAMTTRPGIVSEDRLLALTTIGFDISGLELFCPLVRGGTVALADTAITRDGAKLVDLVERIKPSVMQATPAGWRLLIEAGWKGDGQLKMLCGGEALDSALADLLQARGGELWNLYGPTETTIWSAAAKVDIGLTGHGVPVSGPIDRTELYVLDLRGEPVPVGITGELHIGGAGLSPGYWRRPDLSAEKFVPNPFRSGQEDGLHLYRTGDRVRWHDNGTLEFLGRIDNQIKLRGYRVEPGEIESRLVAHPEVSEAAVLLDQASSGARLVAYLRWRDAAPGNPAAALRDHLAQTLPSYMMPATYISLADFPLTPNGKVDRRALLAISGAAPEKTAAKPYVFGEPAATLVDIWKHVLEVESVLPGDNFFDLGGHSLLVTRLQSAVRDRFGVTLDITDFFRFPTLEALAARIAAANGNGGHDADVPEGRMQMRSAGRERLSQRRKRTARI